MSKNGNKAEKPVRAERKATFAGALIAFLLCPTSSTSDSVF